MDEVACLMDWDLQAIVRGCTSEASGTIIGDPYPNFPRFRSHEQDHDFLCTTFPEFSETTKVLDELAELYKPFYPVLHPLSPTGSVSIPEEVKASSKEVQDLQDPAVSKCKRSKKNQNKRVVKQVSADGLCDTWAWRKYGQKPIKGSPYPRSYYRCSSSKGCLARKQVERSHLDPGVFIVTYTAEHSHNHPPRTRKTKYSAASETAQAQPSCSPATPLEDSIEDELVPNGQIEGLKKEEHVFEASDEPVTADTLASYDWIPSIEDLNGLGQEFALDGYFMDFAGT